MDWTAVGTILATGTVTFGSVWLKGRYDFRVEKERITAQNETVQAERELAASQEEEQRRLSARQQELKDGATALAAFGAILDGLAREPDDTPPSVMEASWKQGFDAQARQVVELISDSQAREDMLTVLEALGDFDEYSRINNQRSYGGHNARVLIRTLLELAGAVSRGEKPSAKLRAKVDSFRASVQAVDDYYAMLRDHAVSFEEES